MKIHKKQSTIFQFESKDLKTGLINALDNRIRFLLDKSGVSQADLCNIMGISQTYISLIMNKRIKPLSDNMIRCIALSFRINKPDGGWSLATQLVKADSDMQIDRVTPPHTMIGTRNLIQWEEEYLKYRDEVALRNSKPLVQLINEGEKKLSEVVNEQRKEQDPVNLTPIKPKIEQGTFQYAQAAIDREELLKKQQEEEKQKQQAKEKQKEPINDDPVRKVPSTNGIGIKVGENEEFIITITIRRRKL